MESPKISLLMSTYNRPQYLKEALKSVVAQSLEDWEVILINDGGVDVSDIVAGIGDSRIKYIKDTVNRGKAVRMNQALESARGRYIAYLDDDDILYPNHFEELSRALDADSEVGAAYSDLYGVQFIKDEKTGRRYVLNKFIQVSRDYNRDFMFHFNHTLHVSLMHRRDLALQAGGYDPNVTVLIDWNITRKLSFYTDFKYVPRVTGEYYMPLGASDRISNLERKDPERFKHNLRKIKADLPPEPWPKVKRIGVVVPVKKWDGDFKQRLADFLDHIDYPVKWVLVNNSSPLTPLEYCRKMIGPLADLKNVTILTPSRTLSDLDAYRFGASRLETDYVYLPTEQADPKLPFRIIRAVPYLEAAGKSGIKWNVKDEPKSKFDIIIKRSQFLKKSNKANRNKAFNVPLLNGEVPESLKSDYLYTLIHKKIKEEDFKGAFELIKEIEKIQDGAPTGRTFIDAYVNVCTGLKYYDLAEDKCRRLLAEGCGGKNWMLLGKILQSRRAFAEAEEAYRAGLRDLGLETDDLLNLGVIKNLPEDFAVVVGALGLGECLTEKGDLPEAAKMFRRAARVKPESPRPFLGFARIFIKTGDLKKAREAISDLIRRDQATAEAYLLLGTIEEKENNLRAAFEAYRRSLELDPKEPETQKALFRCGERLQLFSETLEALEKAHQECPASITCIKLIARSATALGLIDKAIHAVEMANNLRLIDPELHSILARSSKLYTPEIPTNTASKLVDSSKEIAAAGHSEFEHKKLNEDVNLYSSLDTMRASLEELLNSIEGPAASRDRPSEASCAMEAINAYFSSLSNAHAQILNDYLSGNRRDNIKIIDQFLAYGKRLLAAIDKISKRHIEDRDFSTAAKLLNDSLPLRADQAETLLEIIDCLILSHNYCEAKSLLENFPANSHSKKSRPIEARLKHLASMLDVAFNSESAPVEARIRYSLYEKKTRDAREMLFTASKSPSDSIRLNGLLKEIKRKEKLLNLPIAIVTAADILEKNPSRKLRWGDYWFGKELTEALSNKGAVITNVNPKVIIHCHGVPLDLSRYPAYKILWIHSHPDLIKAETLRQYDHIFSLSPSFIPTIKRFGRNCEPLIGGTSKAALQGRVELSDNIVFVGNGKNGKGRKIITDLVSLGGKWLDRLRVWGEGWEGILPSRCIRGLYFDNNELARLYASAMVVLNDHHEDMRREGFINPRILDVMASGGVVISDSFKGQQEILGHNFLTYESPEQLDMLLQLLFDNQQFREATTRLGSRLVRSYNFTKVADELIEHILSIDENDIDRRHKNHYMNSVWAPVEGKIHTDRIRNLKKITAEQCTGTVLDIGCANCDSTAVMLEHNPSLSFTGLELTDLGCREAKRKHPNIFIVQGDAASLPFANQSFDTVVLDHVIEHFMDPVPLIIEAKRVAKRRVVIGIPLMHLNDPDHKIAWRLDDFERLLFGFFPHYSIRGMREPDGIEMPSPDSWNFVVATGSLEPGNRKELTVTNPLKLHLGCGNVRLKGFVNIDMIASPAVDLLCDSRRLPFQAGSVARIETYHMIEHLPRHDLICALYEWNRVLQEGGDLIIECPDFDATLREYVSGKKFRINNIFGLQRHKGDFHMFGYTFESLKEILHEIGFGGVKKEKPTDYHAKDEPSLRVSAIKIQSVRRPPDVIKSSIERTAKNYAASLEMESLKVEGQRIVPKVQHYGSLINEGQAHETELGTEPAAAIH